MRGEKKTEAGTPKDLRPSAVEARLREKVYGQDEACRKLVEAVLAIRRRCVKSLEGVPSDELPNLRAVLAMGSTATGKSYAIKTLLDDLGIKWFAANCSGLSRAGWKGAGVDDALLGVADWQKSHPGEICAVFWDEFDKVSITGEEYRPSSAAFDFLKPLDGGTYQVYSERSSAFSSSVADMDAVIHVFAGAFTGIEDIVRRRLAKESGRAQVGFAPAAGMSSLDMGADELRALCNQADLQEWGIPRELCGRIAFMVSFDELSEDDLADIARGPFVKRYSNLMPYGAALSAAEDAVLFAASRAHALKLGARGLEKTLGAACVMASSLAEDDEGVVAVEIVEAGGALSLAEKRGERPVKPAAAKQVRVDPDFFRSASFHFSYKAESPEVEKLLDVQFDDIDALRGFPYSGELCEMVSPEEFAKLASPVLIDEACQILTSGVDYEGAAERSLARDMMKAAMVFMIHRYPRRFIDLGTLLIVLSNAKTSTSADRLRFSCFNLLMGDCAKGTAYGAYALELESGEGSGSQRVMPASILRRIVSRMRLDWLPDEQMAARLAMTRLTKAANDSKELKELQRDIAELLASEPD